MSSQVTCKTCGNQFLGNYCNVCGEKIIHQKDRKLKYFIGELINALTFADNKFVAFSKNGGHNHWKAVSIV